jgi:hypothetical protein
MHRYRLWSPFCLWKIQEGKYLIPLPTYYVSVIAKCNYAHINKM